MFDMSIFTKRFHLAKEDIDYEDVEKISLLERDESNNSCGFKVLYFWPLLGKAFQFLTSIFSIGLVQPPTRVAWYYISHLSAKRLSFLKKTSIFWLVPLPTNSHHQDFDICISATIIGRGPHKTPLTYRISIFFGSKLTQKFRQQGVPLQSRSPRRLWRWFRNISPTPCGRQHIWSIPLLICKEPYVRLYLRYHQR